MDSDQFKNFLSDMFMDVLQEIIKKCDPLEIMMLMIVYGKNVDILRILRKINNLWNVGCSHAAKKLFECVKWFRENNYPWEADMCVCSSKWSFELSKVGQCKGCPWNEWTCAHALKWSFRNILKWASQMVVHGTNEHSHKRLKWSFGDILKWARENGCSFVPWTCALPSSKWSF